MQQSPINRKWYLAVGVVIFLLVVGVVYLLTRPKPSPAPAPPTPQEPAVLGTEKLIDYGLTYDQVQAVEYGFKQYLKKINKPAGKVQIDETSVATPPQEPHSDKFTATFKATIEDAEADCRVEYSGLSVVRLYINENGQQVYDSGDIDWSQLKSSGFATD